MDLPPYNPDPRESPRWEIDRKIPVALLLAFLTNAFLTGWWVATTSARLDRVEAAVASAAKVPESMARIDEKMNSLREDVGTLKEDIRRLGMRGGKP